MAPEKLNAMLRSMSVRLACQPAHQPILQQLDILLDSPQRLLPATHELGRLLIDAGLFDEAEELYKEMAEQFPDKPQGRVGMAQLAMQKKAWEQALAYWDEAIARFSDRVTGSWLGGRGITLMQLGRFEEAEQILRSVAHDFNDDWHGLVGLAQLAMSQGFWSDALALWDEVLTRFREQADPNWHAGRGSTLIQLDRLEEAEQIFRRLADDFPTHPSGFLGRAGIAVRRATWPEALSHWDELIARFSRAPNPSWQMARANVLVELGRADEAEAVYRHILKSNPDSLPGLMGVLRALIAKGQPQEAAFALESSPFRSLEVVSVVEKKLHILTMLKRFGEARAEFDQLLLKTSDPAMLNTLFTYIPSLHKAECRAEIWSTLLKKLDSLQRQANLGSAAILALRARILLALRDYGQFLALVSGAKERDLGEHWRSLLAIASKLRDPSFPDYHAPKVFVVGMAKTGTSSLSAALTALGFQTLHSYNPLTHEQICEDDLPLFDAFADAPVCANFEKCYSMFSNSKFIYTVRPFESWKKSMMDHFFRVYGHSDFAELKLALSPFVADIFNSYPTMLFKNNDYEEAYHGYDRRVRCFFQDKPKDRFLEFDVSTGGWEELCGFTGRALPSIPFPWLNRKPRTSVPDLI